MHEIAMHLRHDLRVLEHGFGNERTRLHVAAPLELEEIALGADDRALGQALEETARRTATLRPTDSGCC